MKTSKDTIQYMKHLTELQHTLYSVKTFLLRVFCGHIWSFTNLELGIRSEIAFHTLPFTVLVIRMLA